MVVGELVPSSWILLLEGDDPGPPVVASVAADLSDKASSKIRLAGPSIVRRALSINKRRASSNSMYCLGGPRLGGSLAKTHSISDLRHLAHGCTPSHLT